MLTSFSFERFLKNGHLTFKHINIILVLVKE